MFPVLIKLGPLTLHTYGLMVALGFLAAYTLARHRLESAGLTAALIDNVALVAMLGGLFGARLLFFIVDPTTHFLSDPLAFFRIWEGGLVYYGGFLGAILSLFVFSLIKKISFFTITDGLSAPLILGQALGRIGCFAAGCCYGKPTADFWGVTFTRPDSLAPLGIPLHPTQLYESTGNFVLFGFLLFLEKKASKRGYSTAAYLMGYGLFRFFIETVRGDERGPFEVGFSPSQIISLLAVLAGAAFLIYESRKKEV